MTQAAIERLIRAAKRQGLAVVAIVQEKDGSAHVLTADAADRPMSEIERWRAARDAKRASSRTQ